MHKRIYLSAFILALFVLVSGSTLLEARGFQRYNEKEEFLKSFPMGKDGTFILTNLNGSVSIETWNRDEVEIRAEKSVRGRRENLDKIKIEIDSGANQIIVKTV